jgi:exodeoxyribonuclease VII small subunit
MNVSSQILSKPKITLYNRIKDIESKIDNLGTFTAMYLKNQHGNLGHFVSILKVMAPENILKKGFAIVKVNQKITSNPSDIEQTMTYEEAFGELALIAKDIESENVSIDVLAEKVKRASELITFCQTKLRSTESEVNNIIAQMRDDQT